jgi:hypothetical protein
VNIRGYCSFASGWATLGGMPDVGGAVQRLADACRKTMAEGDRLLPKNSAEQKILQALVADTADSADSWVNSRVPNGKTVAEPLTALLPYLRKGDIVGQTLASAQKELTDQARSIVLKAVGTATLPAWAGSVVAFFAGLFLLASDIGAAVGKVAVTTLLGGGVAAIFVLRAVFASGKLVQATPDAAGRLWESIDVIGSQAEKILSEHASPAVADLKRCGYPGDISRRAVTVIRGSAKTITGITYTVLAVCVVVFAFGVISGASDAWNQWQACHPTVPTLSSTKC